jgi:hypothetical protein
MEFGKGCFIIQGQKYQGLVCLDTKLYLKDRHGTPVIETYLPLEKIEFMKLHRRKLEIRIFPSIVDSFVVFILMDRSFLKKIVKAVSDRVGMRKKFMANIWYGDIYSR